MRQQYIQVPEETPLDIEEVTETLADNLLSVPFSNAEGDSVYPVTATTNSGTNNINVEMSDGTCFVVKIEKGE